MTKTRVLGPPESKEPDLLLATIGNFGRWQCRISILMALLKLPMAWFQLSIVFLAPPTAFWCRQPEDFKYLTKSNWIKTIAPLNNNLDASKRSCYMRNVEYVHELSNNTVECKWGYEYDDRIMTTSVISEWNLVCGKEYYVDLIQVTFMSGILLGNFIFGLLADKYGRKRILVACIILQAFFGILSSISPWYFWFLATRFLVALANGGTVVISFVMCMEVVSGKWRTIIPILYQVPFGIGNSIMALLAFTIRDWRELQLILGCMSSIYMVYIWLLPESPRWLVATGRKTKAIQVLEKAQRFNSAKENNIGNILENYVTNGKKVRPEFSTVFKTPTLRRRTFLLSLQWFLCGIVFYAFMQYVGQLGKNLFLNVTLGGLVPIPSSILCIIVVQKFGRKWSIASAQVITCLCLIGIMFVPVNTFFADWPRILLAGVVIVNLTVTTSALTLFTGELYPTIIRNAGVGSCVVFFKIGAIIAPLILRLITLEIYLPLLVMSSLAFLQAIAIYPLPESKGTQLPDTIRDVEMMALNNKNISQANQKQMKKLTTSTQDDNCHMVL